MARHQVVSLGTKTLFLPATTPERGVENAARRWLGHPLAHPEFYSNALCAGKQLVPQSTLTAVSNGGPGLSWLAQCAKARKRICSEAANASESPFAAFWSRSMQTAKGR